jgi:hypothetical protein
VSEKVAHLKLKDGAKPRAHRTIAVDDLAAILAQAEELGYRRALSDARVDPKEALRLRTNHESMYSARVSIYAAIWRRAEKGI